MYNHKRVSLINRNFWQSFRPAGWQLAVGVCGIFDLHLHRLVMMVIPELRT